MQMQTELQSLSLEKDALKIFDNATYTAATLIVAAMNDSEQTIKFRSDMAQIVLDRGIGKARAVTSPIDEYHGIVNVSDLDGNVLDTLEY